MTDANKKLRSAVELGDTVSMNAAVAQGADVNNLDSNYSPLVWAAEAKKPEAVRWLLDHGAKPDVRSGNGWTPLMSAANHGQAEIVRLLLDAGADPHLQTKENGTAIKAARDKGYTEILNLLTRTPDEIIFTDRVFDRVVQEVYSFKRKERFTFIRKEELGDIEAVQRDSFESLSQTQGLRDAFNEHKKRGGKMTEDEVFPTALHKPRITAQPSP